MSDQDMAATFGENSWLRREFGAVPAEVFERFLEANKVPAHLEERFTTSLRVTLASTNDLECILEEADYSGWGVLYEQYAGVQGVMTISRAAFDNTGTRALVCAGSWQGGLHGAAYCAAMANRNNRWTLQQAACVRTS